MAQLSTCTHKSCCRRTSFNKIWQFHHLRTFHVSNLRKVPPARNLPSLKKWKSSATLGFLRRVSTFPKRGTAFSATSSREHNPQDRRTNRVQASTPLQLSRLVLHSFLHGLPLVRSNRSKPSDMWTRWCHERKTFKAQHTPRKSSGWNHLN